MVSVSIYYDNAVSFNLFDFANIIGKKYILAWWCDYTLHFYYYEWVWSIEDVPGNGKERSLEILIWV